MAAYITKLLVSKGYDLILIVLQTQVLRVRQANEPCIGLTQENLIENSIQKCLSYILSYDSPCYYFSSLL